jgi:hypothetical protein
MEEETLHRAADTITELLKAHVSDSPESVDVHQAIADRDELRELARELGDSYDLPEVGDVVMDKDHNPRFGDGKVEVTEVLPNAEARTHYIECQTGKRSVAYKNPDRDEYSPIVKGKYVNGSNKVYAFPCTRLEG